MAIWSKKYSLEEVNQISKNTMLEHLGIEITEIGDDYLKATMPVDHRTIQPAGLLHGGASVALAESLGSIASAMTIDINKKQCVGLEVNANHIRPVEKGFVEGTARSVHLGSKIQIWDIEIRSSEDKLICVSRITVAILENSR